MIRESKRVGELLLKAGDQELAAVQQQAEHLLDKFRLVGVFQGLLHHRFQYSTGTGMGDKSQLGRRARGS